MSGPPPPPPPMMAPPKKAFTSAPASSGAPDMRNALLGQIQKGAKLKKVQTVDKSKPIISGRIAGGANSSSPSPVHSRGPSSNKTSPDTPSSSLTGSPMSKPGQFTNIADELQYKLTLKKNKSSPTKDTQQHVIETKEVRKMIHCE